MRAYTVAENPSFLAAFKKCRCVVLADGNSEWLLDAKNKQAYHYEIDGGKPFALAGHWEW